MTDWFEKQRAQENAKEEPKGRELITEFNDMLEHFNEIMRKLNIMTNEAFQMILPSFSKLMGNDFDKSNPDVGKIKEIQQTIRESKLRVLPIANDINSILDLSYESHLWMLRYSKMLEQYVDEIGFVTQSAFKKIIGLEEQIEGFHTMIEDLKQGEYKRKDGMPAIQGNLGVPRYEPNESAKKPIEKEEKPIQEEPIIISEERKAKLIEMYNNCKAPVQLARLVNDMTNPMKLSSDDIKFIKSYNLIVRKFKQTK